MSIYIGNDLEDRLEALEAENASLRRYNEYRQIVDEIDHMSDLHLDSSFYKRSMKLDKYVKIEEWFDSSLGQSTVIHRLDLKKPTLSKQTQNKRKYVNFENGSHFICSFNLNNPETTVCIVFKMTNIASGDQLLVNSLIGNSDQKANSKFITFYKTYSGLGLLISKAQSGSYVAITLYNVCSVHRGMFSTSGGGQYIGGWSVHRGDTMSTSGGYHEYIGGCSVHRGDIMMNVGDTMSTSGDVQYIGGIP